MKVKRINGRGEIFRYAIEMRISRYLGHLPGY